jgi:histidinol-phosphate aminotransferase
MIGKRLRFKNSIGKATSAKRHLAYPHFVSVFGICVFFKPMTFLRQHLQNVTGYTPGEQPLTGSTVLKLNTNENPYPPSPEVAKVLQNLDLEGLRRYPDPTARIFREAARDVFQVSADSVIVGNGSDELLGLIMRAFAEKGARVVYPMPSYVLYRTLAELQDAQPFEILYDDAFRFSFQELKEAQGAITLIASPNSPTGHTVAIQDLDALAGSLKGILVIDEAYVDFANNHALHLVQKHANVIVLRTLSKGYSLAGLRLGFAIAQPALIRDLSKIKDSYAVDMIAALAGAAALRDQAHKDLNVGKVLQSRPILQQQLETLGFRVWPSAANFLLVQPPKGFQAVELQQALKTQGILVRYFNLPSVEDKLRITVGTDAQNERLCGCLAALYKAAQA